MVCHDGSKSSCDALTECYGSLMKDHDTLTVAHVYNDEKEKYLKFDLKRDYIRGTSEAQCVSLGKRYFFAEREHHGNTAGDTIKSNLNDLAKERHIDIQVVGYHGRKGPKTDPTVMGSAIGFLSINTCSPVLIVKDPIDRVNVPDGSYNHALCTDGSKQSNEALELICKVK